MNGKYYDYSAEKMKTGNIPEKMEEENGDFWYENELLKLMYKHDNYKVLDMSFNDCEHRQTADAIVFFSGNGLYFPNTEEEFRRRILQEDRYEWENIAKSSLIKRTYTRIIFVRDIYKQWYVNGINDKINSVEKVIELIHGLTKGFSVVTCGNSAGGFMAVLTGKVLGAKKIFSFSGQFSVENQISKSPLLKYYEGNLNYSKYYNLSTLLKKEGKVFHFYPAYALCDIEQINLLAMMDRTTVYTFAFDEKIHGKTVEGDCFEYLLTMGLEHLAGLSEKYRFQLIKKTDFSETVLFNHEIFESRHLKLLVQKQTDFYIWGMGSDGEICYRFFKRIGLKIKGIIDSYKKQDMWHGYKVIKPHELEMTGIICIAARKYERDIVKQLQRMNVSEERYICFEQLKEYFFNGLSINTGLQL